MNKPHLSRRAVLVGSGASLASLALANTSLSASVFESSTQQTGNQAWTIGAGQLQRKISFDPAIGLFTQAMTDVVTRYDFIAENAGEKPAHEFSFQCSGKTYTGASASFELVHGEETKTKNGSLLTVSLRHKTIPLEVSVFYATYDGHSAIRKWLLLKNTGTAALQLTHLTIEALAPTVGPSNETLLNAQYGAIPRETFYTGRSEDACLLISNGRTGHGFAILSEVPGYMKRTEIDANYVAGRVRIDVLYDTDLMPFSRSLAPGESFKTAAVSLVSYRNGDGFRDPRWVLPSYTSEVLQRRLGTKAAPWIYNTWVPFKRTIDSAIAQESIEAAGKMGIDIFTIDDGWQQEYGENAVNLTAFPNGLDSIRSAVEARGIRLGLWIPLAAISKNVQTYKDHPEWVEEDLSGEKKVTSTAGGEMVVMCMASAFRDTAADRISDAIERFHLAYVKLDLTTIFNAYGEAPGCWAKGHLHQSWSESLGMIYEGISYVTAKVYKKHPEVLLDLTFELWGQKHVIDAGLLAAGDLDWLSNISNAQRDSAGPIQVRTLLYQRAVSMPVESMLIGNLQADVATPLELFATVIGSAPVLLGDLRKISKADVEWYRAHTDWFKKLRAQTPIHQSFFPLGSWQQPSPVEWDGFARLSRAGNGILVLFRNESPSATAKVQLPLLPPGKYRMHSVVSDKEFSVFNQDQCAAGIQVKFLDAQPVEIFEVIRLT